LLVVTELLEEEPEVALLLVLVDFSEQLGLCTPATC
jgi:hypothetical protein